jgi:guanine deaminase
MAVELSRSYRDDPRRWPFGAIVVEQGKVVGRGFNQVVELRDPSAHAEIMALRAAGGALGRHALEDCVLYSSSELCPMCLAACYWASVPRVVFAATSRDLAGYDFQDLAFYTELGLPAERRSMREDADGENSGKKPSTSPSTQPRSGRSPPPSSSSPRPPTPARTLSSPAAPGRSRDRGHVGDADLQALYGTARVRDRPQGLAGGRCGLRVGAPVAR